MSALRFLARDRFNFIDALATTASTSALVTGQFAWAAFLFVAGAVISALLSVLAKGGSK